MAYQKGKQYVYEAKKPVALERLLQFRNSERRKLSDLTNNPVGYLKGGDILNRKLNQASGAASGFHNGETEHFSLHYAVYERYDAAKDRHYLIEKVDKGLQNNGCVERFEESSANLLAHYSLVVSARYQETLGVACFLLNTNFDAGYSHSHSNHEHFVTYCLTRFSELSESQQFKRAKDLRDGLALIGTPIGNFFKKLQYPSYRTDHRHRSAFRIRWRRDRQETEAPHRSLRERPLNLLDAI